MEELSLIQLLKNSDHNPEIIALKDDTQKVSYGDLFHEIDIRAK